SRQTFAHRRRPRPRGSSSRISASSMNGSSAPAEASLGRGARRSLELKVARLGQAHERLGRAPALLVERRRAALEQAAGRLRALSPKATLNRGYAIVRANETIVRSVGAAETGERIDVEVSD